MPDEMTGSGGLVRLVLAPRMSPAEPDYGKVCIQEINPPQRRTRMRWYFDLRLASEVISALPRSVVSNALKCPYLVTDVVVCLFQSSWISWLCGWRELGPLNFQPWAAWKEKKGGPIRASRGVVLVTVQGFRGCRTECNSGRDEIQHLTRPNLNPGILSTLHVNRVSICLC